MSWTQDRRETLPVLRTKDIAVVAGTVAAVVVTELTLIDPVAHVAPPPPLIHEMHEWVNVGPGDEDHGEVPRRTRTLCPALPALPAPDYGLALDHG